MPKGKSKRTSLIASITNRPTGGGNKKEGLPPLVGTGNLSIWNGMGRAYGTPEDRNKLFCINQLGSVNPRVYQTRAPSDGVRPCPKNNKKKPLNLNDAVTSIGGKVNPSQQSLLGVGRGIDLSRKGGADLITNDQLKSVVDNLDRTCKNIVCPAIYPLPPCTSEGQCCCSKNKDIVEINLQGQTRITSLDQLLNNAIMRGQLRTLNLSGIRLNTNSWYLLSGRLTQLGNTNRIVNLDLSNSNIHIGAILQLLNVNSLVTLNLDFLVPELTNANLKTISENVESANSNLRLLSMRTHQRSSQTFIKNSKLQSNSFNKGITASRKVADSNVPAILDLEIVPNIDEKKIVVIPTIQGNNREKIGVRYNWFFKKNIYKKGIKLIELTSSLISSSSNELNYKTPTQMTGSLGLKDNEYLKCIVTPFLKENSKIIEGKSQEIELIKNDWKPVKKVIKNEERPMVLSTPGDSDVTLTSEDQSNYVPSDKVLAAKSLLNSSLDTAIISGSELNSTDFEYLFNEIKNKEPTILRLIMIGSFPANISSQIPSSVNYQDMLDKGYKQYLFNQTRVLPENIPSVISNPMFGGRDSATNTEIRQSLISTSSDQNSFFVPIIFLAQDSEYEYASFK